MQACKALYIKSIEVFVEHASLQTLFVTFDDSIKTTNRRVNALENVLKPRLENTIVYIKGELDELERGFLFPINNKHHSTMWENKRKQESGNYISSCQNQQIRRDTP